MKIESNDRSYVQHLRSVMVYNYPHDTIRNYSVLQYYVGNGIGYRSYGIHGRSVPAILSLVN